jgi:hypothetical protein
MILFGEQGAVRTEIGGSRSRGLTSGSMRLASLTAHPLSVRIAFLRMR